MTAQPDQASASMIRHRPAVTRYVGDLGEGEGWVYRMRCTCGATKESYHHSGADNARRYHLEFEAAIDPDERCRNRRHRVADWNVCELCADQLPLF